MFLTIISLLLALTFSTEASSLNISIYYESLCPYSKDFITNQLYPVYKQIPEYINVEFVPFGNAEVVKAPDGAKFFLCQHGPNECYGNEIQACAILLNRKFSIDFIDCAMASDDASDNTNLKKCAASSDITWELIDDCITTGVGAQLFILNSDITASLNPPLPFVPYILFNGVYNSKLQDAAQTDFAALACRLLNKEPNICN